MLCPVLLLQVVLHGKILPWFVSDTLVRDLQHLLDACGGGTASETAINNVTSDVTTAAKRWQAHLDSGKWRFTADNFWTTPFPFWWMEQVRPEGSTCY
jgi:hypothetical protein